MKRYFVVKKKTSAYGLNSYAKALRLHIKAHGHGAPSLKFVIRLELYDVRTLRRTGYFCHRTQLIWDPLRPVDLQDATNSSPPGGSQGGWTQNMLSKLHKNHQNVRLPRSGRSPLGTGCVHLRPWLRHGRSALGSPKWQKYPVRSKSAQNGQNKTKKIIKVLNCK